MLSTIYSCFTICFNSSTYKKTNMSHVTLFYLFVFIHKMVHGNTRIVRLGCQMDFGVLKKMCLWSSSPTGRVRIIHLPFVCHTFCKVFPSHIWDCSATSFPWLFCVLLADSGSLYSVEPSCYSSWSTGWSLFQKLGLVVFFYFLFPPLKKRNKCVYQYLK